MAPTWLHILSILTLLLGGACAIGLAVDVARRPQPMAVMNVVWPVCALFGTLAVVWAYLRYGRRQGTAPTVHTITGHRTRTPRREARRPTR